MPTPYAKALAKLAEDEFDNFGGLHETTSTMQTRIKMYWTSIGLSFPGVSTAWSAVFVSSHVKRAGATAAEFKFAAAHSKFVRKAISNAVNATGVFRAFPVTDYAPKIGDIIQNNRNGNNFTYNFAKTHDAYESHSTIVVEEGADGSGRYVRTIGGNEGDAVGDRVVRLTSDGLIKQPTTTPKYYICVIQTLK
jgi:Uncharacterized protein conserved in bacteria